MKPQFIGLRMLTKWLIEEAVKPKYPTLEKLMEGIPPTALTSPKILKTPSFTATRTPKTALTLTPAQGTKAIDMPTTAETVAELKRRLGMELYRIELDLQRGARIAGKPCDCLTTSKHTGAVVATAEELMSYEVNPVFGQIVSWIAAHQWEFEPREIAKREPAYYQALTPQVREFRKTVMGTENPLAVLTPEQKTAVFQKINQSS